MSSISACVPTISGSSPVASLPSRSRRRPAGVEPVSSAAGTSAPGISAWSVAKCCSASVSVGAMSAACIPCSTARSIACSATTVLPEPTSPISSRCIGRSRGEVGVDLARSRSRWSPVGVNGSSSSRHARESVGGSRRARRPRAPARRSRAQAQLDELVEQQLVEGQPPAAALAVAEVRGGERGGPVGQALGDAQRGGQRLDHVGDRAAVLADRAR